MPVLKNPKHERFAQELAKGKTADEAYIIAGYAENRFNASRLKTNEYILHRIEEILSSAAESAEVTIDWLRRMFLEDRALARQLGQPSAAVSAMNSIGKLYGLMIDRKDVTIRKDVKELSDHELADILAGSRKGNGSTEIDPSQLN
jgi:hypothetical protein